MPELILTIITIVVILLDLFIQKKVWLTVISIAGIAVATGFAVTIWGESPKTIFNNLLAVDNFAVFFKILLLAIVALVLLASRDYVSKLHRFQGEYHALVLLAAIGMMLMAASTDLISIFISLELSAIAFYALVGFLKDDRSTEASLKFILLGGIASAVLLFGMALTFGFTGKTQLTEIAQVIQQMSPESLLASSGLILGLVLMIAGFGFKIAAAPFQMWVPDVYEGAPTPVTLYLSVGSKIAGFAIILRVFFSAFGSPEALSQDWGLVFAVLSAIGMTLGNIIAIHQANIKRMLAYSSIAHSGYIMIGLAAVGLTPLGDFTGQSFILFYVIAFALADLAAFIAVIVISSKLNSDLIKDYAGIGKRSPVLSIALTLSLISLIGLPPTAGFLAKFYIFTGAAASGLLWLLIVAVINSVISVYYYLRVVKVIWLGEPLFEGKIQSSNAAKFSLAICCLGILLLGIIPAIIMKFVETAASSLSF
ncbi:MAG: NADH-quinone oxidoreductase subunit N [Dehalococcoidia bacterium]|nr:MAG: NADH-quinone oxidoreductase subunit N [Dehalococcoidia bacterium]